MVGFIAFLLALPKLLDLFQRFGNAWSEHKMDDWLNGLDDATRQFETAKDQGSRIDALQKLAAAARNIPRK